MPETDAAPSTATSETVVADGHSAAVGFAMLLDQIQQGQDGSSAVESLINIANSVEHDDISMGGVRDEPGNAVAGEAAASTQTPITPLTEDQRAVDDVYVLVKMFNAKSQTLETRGSLMMSKKDRISGMLERLAISEPGKSFEIFCDEGGKFRDGHFKARHTFEAEDLGHGAVLVVQEKLLDTK